jgi:hypothetical protein
VSRPFPSWNRSISTEIYLCHACSYHDILRTDTAGQDLWDTDAPAITLSNRSRDEGIYEERLFAERLGELLERYAKSAPAPAAPLFLVYAARIAHYPIQAPAAFQELPHIAAIETPHRLVYHAQVN